MSGCRRPSACSLLVFLSSSVILLLSRRLLASALYTDYCVVGAGPSGLQIGYFLERAGRDYVIFERSNISGSFYAQYPRHRKLISINKRHTGKTNKEFNLRHDWNSLISDDESLQMTKYSRKMFPDADTLLDYLRDYREKLGLNVQFNTEVRNIQKEPCESVPDGHIYTMVDQNANSYRCGKLILATGISKPMIPDLQGLEHTEGYETMSLDPDDYEGQTVLILGRGNSAFETATHIYGATNLIHMVGRSRVRLSWATHYVGDLRAINNELLDTYQLKSLDGVLEASINEIAIVKNAEGKLYLKIREEVSPDGQPSVPEDEMFDNFAMREPYDRIIRCLGFQFDNGIFNDFAIVKNAEGKLYLKIREEVSPDGQPSVPEDEMFDNFAMREPYDRIIRCLGFQFDNGIFNESLKLSRPKGRSKKYPSIKNDYESVDHPGLFVAGTASHSLDFRKSAGGFIHGFRYTARALHRLLEWRYHGVRWPSTSAPHSQLVSHILRRINEASGTYQMFSMLGDVIILNDDNSTYTYLEEYPIHLVHSLPTTTGHGHGASRVIVINLQYGASFSGPGNDIFRLDRATGDPSEAHESNFLHPTLYYYKCLPTEAAMKYIPRKEHLPQPDAMHHIVEDFLTTWDGPISHILPLRRFLENVLSKDMRARFADACLLEGLTHTDSSPHCEEFYMQGQGLTGSAAFLASRKAES